MTKTFAKGQQVVTHSGRRAVCIEDTMVVTNSETGHVTATVAVQFSADDEVFPNGTWVWNTWGLSAYGDYLRDGKPSATAQQYADLMEREQ